MKATPLIVLATDLPIPNPESLLSHLTKYGDIAFGVSVLVILASLAFSIIYAGYRWIMRPLMAARASELNTTRDISTQQAILTQNLKDTSSQQAALVERTKDVIEAADGLVVHIKDLHEVARQWAATKSN